MVQNSISIWKIGQWLTKTTIYLHWGGLFIVITSCLSKQVDKLTCHLPTSPSNPNIRKHQSNSGALESNRNEKHHKLSLLPRLFSTLLETFAATPLEKNGNMSDAESPPWTLLDKVFSTRRWLRVEGMRNFRGFEGLGEIPLSGFMKTLLASVLLFSLSCAESSKVEKNGTWGNTGTLAALIWLWNTPQSFPCSHILSSCHKYCQVKEKDLP